MRTFDNFGLELLQRQFARCCITMSDTREKQHKSHSMIAKTLNIHLKRYEMDTLIRS